VKESILNTVLLFISKRWVLGPNGAGKSTSMQMITGNLAPTTGQITINGFDIIDCPIQAKSCIGYLPENPPVYRELTVDEYLTYCARLHRIPSAELNWPSSNGW